MGRRTFGILVVLFACAISTGRVWAQDSLLPAALPEGNLVAVGVGLYPDYIGSDDYAIGAIPLARYEFWGNRDIQLIGNTLNVNLLDAGGWRLGPSGILRFGRSRTGRSSCSCTTSTCRRRPGSARAGTTRRSFPPRDALPVRRPVIRPPE